MEETQQFGMDSQNGVQKIQESCLWDPSLCIQDVLQIKNLIDP